MPFGDRLSPLTSAAPESLLLKFVAHHLWDPVRRAETPDHGMPATGESGLRVSEVAREASEIEPRRHGTRLPANGIPKEVAPLVFAFNGTLERLENEFKERQRFLIDAAHELRTPIAIMKAKYYLPKNLSKKPALAVVLHGCTQIPADYDVCSGWSKLADKHASHCSTRNRCGADGHRNGGWAHAEDLEGQQRPGARHPLQHQRNRAWVAARRGKWL